MQEKTITNHSYFAAANGYGGFRSYFDDVFNRKEYDRIYVIKGGPGTGKSSMMKKLSSLLSSNGIYVENIYCSSDPASLDGVIAKTENAKIAMIDGTAPHESDAKIPGAVDEILNLGNAWDDRYLIGMREKTISLNEEKAAAYKCAYSYLKIAGEAAEFIKKRSCRFSREKLKSEIKKWAESNLQIANGKRRIRLISSFGRSGKHILDTPESVCKRLFSVNMGEIKSRFFLSALSNHLQDLGSEFTFMPNALDPDLTDAIIFPDGTGIVAEGKGQTMIFENPFEDDEIDLERIKCAKRLHSDALSEAQRWFAIASDVHFRLEEIYSRSMNFEKNDLIFKEKSEQILKILT